MAEINAGEIIAKEAVKEVLSLRDAFESSAASLKNLVNTSKELGVNIKQAESTKQLRTETTKLTQSQIELQKIEKQIEIANARATKSYQDQQKVLQNLRAEQKERIALGQKDAKLVNEQNSSLKQLEVALNKNRVAYKALADEEARSSKEGKELKAIIDQQDASVKRLNAGIGDFTDNVGHYENGMKGLKLELKAAKDEMANIAATTGTTSKEFVAASTKAGALKDQINDLNDALKNSSASKFENIGTSLKDVGAKLLNLDFEGAATSAKQFAIVSKSLTFKEVIEGLKLFGNTLLTVGKAILTNPLFIIVGVITAAALAFKYFRDEQDKASQRSIDRYKKELEALTTRYDVEIKLQKIVGKQTFELEKAKQQAIIDSSKKSIDAIGEVARFDILQSLLQQRYVQSLNEDKLKQLGEFSKASKDASNELKIIAAEQAEFERKTSADLAKQKKEDLFGLNKFMLQIQIEAQQELANNEDESFNSRIKAIKNYTKIKNQLAKLEYNEALSQENLTDSAILLLKEEYNNKIIQNKKAASKEEQKVNEETTKKAREDALKINANNIAIVKKQIQQELNAAQERLENEKTLLEKEAFARVAAGEEQSKVKKETDEKILALEKSLTDEYIQLQIDRVTKTLAIEGLSTEEQESLTKELYDLKTKLTEAYYGQLGTKSKDAKKIASDDLKSQIDNIKELLKSENLSFDERADLEKKLADLRLKYNSKVLHGVQSTFQNFSDAITTTFNSSRDAAIASLDAISAKNKEAQDKEIADAGDNQKAKDEINAKYAKKEAALEKERQKQLTKHANVEKALAIVSAGIQTALAVLNALSTVKPYPLAVVAAISAGVLGAAQIAAIASKPIPQFFKGTDSAPGGLSWVGEQGVELMRKPGRNFELSPSSATLMDVPRGTEIIPHDQTMRMLAMSALRSNGGSVQEKDSVLVSEVKKLNSNIGNIKQTQTSSSNAYISGLIAYEAKKISEGHIKHQRVISLGKWVK
jgi:hypothetical protein